MAVYEEYMEGCREKWGASGAKRCDSNERDRIAMSKRQPQSMVNYTDTGFKKLKAPPQLWNMLSNYWEKNKDNKQLENWGKGNVYTNNWAAETYMVNIENGGLRGGGMSLKNRIWEAARPTIEQWTGMKLEPSSLYGIRVYTEGAILAPHVDRLPLVSSCIINVAQDVDEPWLLEVYDRHDRAVNVTMEPGDMVLYESGSLLHGRPFALKGRYYANIFIHFQPTGQRLRDNEWEDMDDFHPPYILPGSPEMKNWEARNPAGWKKPSPSAAVVATPEAHAAAQHGDLESLKELAVSNKRALRMKDSNGWEPLHESVRAGHLESVKFLLSQGSDVNELTNHGKGVSPYRIAISSHGKNHDVSQYLAGLGALDVGPEL